MCFITKELNILTAEQDIEVYKLFTGDDKLITLYRHFPYVEGELFKADIKESESVVVIPSTEAESVWITEEYPDHIINWSLYGYVKETLPGLVVLSEGVHSFETAELAESILFYQELQPVCNVSVRKCVIPAGSQYTKNQFGSVISNQIIVKEIVNVELNKQN